MLDEYGDGREEWKSWVCVQGRDYDDEPWNQRWEEKEEIRKDDW